MTTITQDRYVGFDEHYRLWTAQFGESYTAFRPVIKLTRSRTGVSNSSWKSQIRNGQNASTPLSASEQLFDAKPIVCWTSQTSYGQAWSSANLKGVLHIGSGTLPTAHDPYGIALDEAEAQATRQLYKRINQVRTQFAGGIELGQLRMTIRQLVRPAEALRHLLGRHLSKQKSIVKRLEKENLAEMLGIYQGNNRGLDVGNFLGLAPKAVWKGSRRYLRTSPKQSTLKALAESHLEAVYGWLPLISDIRDASIALARLQHDATPQRFRVYGTEHQVNGTSADGTTVNSIPLLIKRDSSARATVVYYGALSDSAMASMTRPPLERLQQISGFGLRDFVPTIWDLIPYSFVVDYFANVGDVLSAACTDTSVVSRLTKVVVIETVHRDVYTINSDKIASGNTSRYKNASGGSAGTYTRTYRTVSRNATGVPVMVPRVNLLGPSSRQWLNLAALYCANRSTRDGYRKGLSFLYG